MKSTCSCFFYTLTGLLFALYLFIGGGICLDCTLKMTKATEYKVRKVSGMKIEVPIAEGDQQAKFSNYRLTSENTIYSSAQS